MSELAVLVTVAGEVLQLVWTDGAETFESDGRITDWWRASPYHRSVERAFEVLAG